MLSLDVLCCVLRELDLKYSQDEGRGGSGRISNTVMVRGLCTSAKCNHSKWVLFCTDEEDILNALG